MLMLVVLLFSILITTFNYGFYHPVSFFILVSLIVILTLIFFRDIKINLLKKDIQQLLIFLFVVCFLLFLFFPKGIYFQNSKASFILDVISLLLLPLIISFAFAHQEREAENKRYYVLVIFALILRILTIIASPKPLIDVFTILKEAPLVLLQGKNPYDTIYSSVYQQIPADYYPYWPASFLLLIPFRLISRDPRLLFILADVAGALLIYLLANKSKNGQLLSLIYLYRPNSTFIIEQSWLTPLSFFLFIFSLFCYLKKKYLFYVITLSCLVSLQPYFGLIAIIFLLFLSLKKKYIFIFLFLILLFNLPFFLWHPGQFLNNTVLVYFQPIEKIPTIPVHLSLNLNTFIYQIFHQDIPLLIAFPIFIFLLIAVMLKLRLNRSTYKQNKNFISKVILSLTFSFFVFFFLFRQAFINYYYFSSSLLMTWLAMIGVKKD